MSHTLGVCGTLFLNSIISLCTHYYLYSARKIEPRTSNFDLQ